MSLLEGTLVQCPYCGEVIELLIDSSVEEQQYIEDCQVCCRPITVVVKAVTGSAPQAEVRQEND